ncbi:MAG: hypothetical protein ACRDF8_00090 [Chloroflexota bacterium]
MGHSMYVRALMLLLRLAARFAPVLALVAARLFRRYRWRVRDNVIAYAPRKLPWSRWPLFVLAGLFAIIGIAVGLYVLAGRLAPG